MEFLADFDRGEQVVDGFGADGWVGIADGTELVFGFLEEIWD